MATANGAADGFCEPPLGSTVTPTPSYCPTSSQDDDIAVAGERRQGHGARAARAQAPGLVGVAGGRVLQRADERCAVLGDDHAAARRTAGGRLQRHDVRVGSRQDRHQRLLVVACVRGRVVLRHRDQREHDRGRDADRRRSRSTASAARRGANLPARRGRLAPRRRAGARPARPRRCDRAGRRAARCRPPPAPARRPSPEHPRRRGGNRRWRRCAARRARPGRRRARPGRAR